MCGESRTHGLEGETVEGRPPMATLLKEEIKWER